MQELSCMQVWGGRKINEDIVLGEIFGRVISQPCCNENQGGDVFYLSL